MARLILRRALAAVPLVLLVLTLAFAVVQLAPGSAADLLVDPRLGPEAQEVVRQRWGLDRPLAEQYLHWIGAALHGDLGISFLYRRPVVALLAEALPATMLLTGTALLLDLLLGTALAVRAARRPGGAFDRVTGILSLGVYGLPSFWLAGVLVLVFSVLLGWLPSAHMASVGAADLPPLARLADLLRHLALPALTLGLVGAAATARYLRAAALDVHASPFVRAARARGIPERRIRWVHALRPALLPVVSLLGLSLPFLVSGSVVVEVVFAWPGMGQLLWKAAFARDLPLILGATLLAAAAVVAGNLLADVLYLVVDPRARSRA